MFTIVAPAKSSRFLLLGIGGVVVTLIGVAVWIGGRSSPASPPAVLSVNPTGLTYKDGIYDASVGYHSPRGENGIHVQLTLAKGAVTDVGVSYDKWMPSPKRFIESAKPVIIGKSIDGLAIGAVSGASLTSEAFNAALERVREQARD